MIKKLIFAILLLAGVFSASAEFRWGPSASVYFGKYYWKQPIIEPHNQVGAQAGVLGELMIPGIGFGIGLGLNYALHSARFDLGEHEIWAADGYGNQEFKLHSIEIPLHLRFKWTRMQGVEQYIAPFVYVGPVFQFHVAQSKCGAIEHPLGSVAIQFGLGAEIFRHFQLSGSYIWNPTYEIQTVKLDNYSARNSGFSINLTYLF